jgi:hypothetical protein
MQSAVSLSNKESQAHSLCNQLTHWPPGRRAHGPGSKALGYLCLRMLVTTLRTAMTTESASHSSSVAAD